MLVLLYIWHILAERCLGTSFWIIWFVDFWAIWGQLIRLGANYMKNSSTPTYRHPWLDLDTSVNQWIPANLQSRFFFEQGCLFKAKYRYKSTYLLSVCVCAGGEWHRDHGACPQCSGSNDSDQADLPALERHQHPLHEEQPSHLLAALRPTGGISAVSGGMYHTVEMFTTSILL